MANGFPIPIGTGDFTTGLSMGEYYDAEGRPGSYVDLGYGSQRTGFQPQGTGGGQGSQLPDWVVPPPPGSMNTMMVSSVTNPYTGETVTVPSGGYSVNDEAARAAAENPQPTQPPVGQDRVGMPVAQPPATQDQVAPPQVSNEAPFVSGIARRDVSMDPIIQQLLFGDGTQTGLFARRFSSGRAHVL